MKAENLRFRIAKELEKEASIESVYDSYDKLLEDDEITAEEAAFIFGYLDAA